MGDILFTVLMVTLVFCIIVVVAAVVMALGLARKKGHLWHPKYTYTVLGLYVVLGFIAMFAMQRQPVLPQVAEATLQQALQAESNMRDIFYDAAYSELDDMYLQEQWTFPVEGETLTIHYPNQYGDQVYVNYSTEQGNEVTLSYYATPTITYNTDMSKYIKLPTISFTDDQLTVSYPSEPERVQFNEMQATLGIVDAMNNANWSIDSAGMQVLYLNVPQNVHIINEDSY